MYLHTAVFALQIADSTVLFAENTVILTEFVYVENCLIEPCLTGASLNAIVHGHLGTEPGPCLTGACLNAIVHGHLGTEPEPCLTGACLNAIVHGHPGP